MKTATEKTKSKQKKVAVFDIDGTIFRSSLLIELVEGLVQAGVFPDACRKTYSRAYKRWVERKDDYGQYISAVIAAFGEYIKGVPEEKFLPVVHTVSTFHHERVYRYTRDLVARLKKKGFYLLAISHSPKYIVEDFGKTLGFDKVYGTFMELDESSRFTGKVLFEDIIFDKAKILQRAVEKEGLTLKGSVGVGDTESDIPFLKLVENPVCFNPNSLLYKAAKRNGWKVVVERKDVVYDMQR